MEDKRASRGQTRGPVGASVAEKSSKRRTLGHGDLELEYREMGGGKYPQKILEFSMYLCGLLSGWLWESLLVTLTRHLEHLCFPFAPSAKTQGQPYWSQRA